MEKLRTVPRKYFVRCAEVDDVVAIRLRDEAGVRLCKEKETGKGIRRRCSVPKYTKERHQRHSI
jgi:hypothetical protein